jgi:hypothetical protein
MAPMARTNSDRHDANINALDDLDLNDMFEGEQDPLFDGLEMDLEEFGEITNDTGPSNKSEAEQSIFNSSSEPRFGLSEIDDADSTIRLSSQDSSTIPLKKSRRKVARKGRISSASEDEDEDDDENHVKKRRRYTKKTQIPIRKIKSDIKIPSMTMVKDKKLNAPTAPSIEKIVSQGSLVAAAGQFGGRHKRIPQLPRASTKLKAISPIPVASYTPAEQIKVEQIVDVTQATIPTQKRSVSLTDASNHSETLWCGLHPSTTTFFPFMTNLPPETSLKKANNAYSSLERVHESLSSHSFVNGQADNCIKLMMLYESVLTEAKKKEIAAGVQSARKVVNSIDRQSLVSDLLSATCHVKRQHDFMAQSLENMERWCKVNFSGDEYRSVYGGEKPNPVLAQFTTPIIRVRVKCLGFKEPKFSSPLMAQITIVKESILPPQIVISQPPSNTFSTALVSNGSTIKKKRVEPVASTAAISPEIDDPCLNYANLKPDIRRQRILDLISKFAMVLESKQIEMDDSRRKALEKQQQALQKVIDDDDLTPLNTLALWKWIEKMGYLTELTEQDIQDTRLYQPELTSDHLVWEETVSNSKAIPTKEPFLGLLQSLLINLDDESENDDDEEEPSDDPMWDSIISEQDDNQGSLLNLTHLSTEERAFLHLRAVGLLDESRPIPESLSSEEANGHNDDCVHDENPSEYDDLLRRMKEHLYELDRLNNSRASFLESSSRAHLDISKTRKVKEERNSQLLSQYNQLIKKQRENKRSARPKNPKKDEDWVPW